MLTMGLPRGDGLQNGSEFFFVLRSELLACEADPQDVCEKRVNIDLKS